MSSYCHNEADDLCSSNANPAMFSSALYDVIAFWRSERGRLLQDCKITSVDLDFVYKL